MIGVSPVEQRFLICVSFIFLEFFLNLKILIKSNELFGKYHLNSLNLIRV